MKPCQVISHTGIAFSVCMIAVVAWARCRITCIIGIPTHSQYMTTFILTPYIFFFQVATALLVAGSTLILWILGRLHLHPPACTPASFKALRCLYNCRWLTYDSFQLMHIMWWPRCSIDKVEESHGGQDEEKSFLQRSQPCHKGPLVCACSYNMLTPTHFSCLPLLLLSSPDTLALLRVGADTFLCSLTLTSLPFRSDELIAPVRCLAFTFLLPEQSHNLSMNLLIYMYAKWSKGK